MIYTTLPVAQLCKNQVIALGRQMENNYRQIIFDVSDFDEPITSLMLVHQRKGDAAPYIVDNVTGTQFAWTITDTDTAYAGYGKGELRINFANGLAKSIVFTTMVVKSITGDTQIPSPLQSWYDAMIDYIDEHAASPEQIEAAVEAYLEEHPIPAPVTSVNGKQGDVVLTATDVGAMPSSYTAPVTSVNTKTGDVVLDASDVGAYEKPNTGIPKTDLSSDVQASLNRADTALQSAPVTSVNNKTGAVTITAQELGALTSESDPVFSASPAAGITSQDISNWDNKSDFSGSYNDLTNKPSIPAAGLPAGGSTGQVLSKSSNADYAAQWTTVSGGGAVDSVNGQTGTVVLDASDVGALPDTYTAPVSSVNTRTGAVTVDEIFWCTWGTTTSAQIEAAIGAGKLPMVTYQDYTYTLRYRNSATNHRFVCNYGGKEKSIACQSGTWIPNGDLTFLTTSYTPPVTSVNGQTGAVTTPNTEYTFSISGNVITVTPSSGTAQTITLPVYQGGVS